MSDDIIREEETPIEDADIPTDDAEEDPTEQPDIDEAKEWEDVEGEDLPTEESE